MIFWYGVIVTFIFGLLVGSFLNVVINRYNTGKGIRGRSFCFSCGKTLRALELIPLVSFLMLRGKCRACGSKISWQYPAVEFLTAMLFSLVFARVWMATGGVGILLIAGLAVSFVVMALLVAIGVYDLKHKIIPDGLVWSFAGIALLRTVFVSAQSGEWLMSLLAGPMLAVPIALIWYFSHGRAMGLGDAKLFLGVGWFLGVTFGFSAFVLAFWLGSIYGLGLLLVGKFPFMSFGVRGVTMKSEIPFAPFIILAFFIVYFLDVNVVSFF